MEKTKSKIKDQDEVWIDGILAGVRRALVEKIGEDAVQTIEQEYGKN